MTTTTLPTAAGSPATDQIDQVRTGAKRSTEDRVERLSALSLKRVVEPDEAVPGSVRDGQLLPDELLSIAGLDLVLTDEQRSVIFARGGCRDREHRCPVRVGPDGGVRVRHPSPRPDGPESELHTPRDRRRDQALPSLLADGLAVEAQVEEPLREPSRRAVERVVIPVLASMPAMFCVAVLTGEEIPDLFQKLAAEHPDTDPFIREVNRYHRQEEARHLAFARMILPELWQKAGFIDRLMVKHVAPLVAGGMFDAMVNPGVYTVVGLPGWRTWRAANRTPQRLELKHAALRPLLAALMDAGAVVPGRIPRAWRLVCAVDRKGSAT